MELPVTHRKGGGGKQRRGEPVVPASRANRLQDRQNIHRNISRAEAPPLRAGRSPRLPSDLARGALPRDVLLED